MTEHQYVAPPEGQKELATFPYELDYAAPLMRLEKLLRRASEACTARDWEQAQQCCTEIAEQHARFADSVQAYKQWEQRQRTA